MSKIATLIIIALLGFGAFMLLRPQKSQEIHYHAGFQVYKDNVLQDYSTLEYMHIAPCNENEHEKELTSDEEQEEKAHLHDSIGDVVHVHREGVIWADLFTNIKVSLNPKEAYVNGEKVEDILSLPVNAYDSVVIFEGENSDVADKVGSAVTKEHIVEVEGRSETCGS